MRTSKPLTNICYCTTPYIIAALNKLIDEKYLQWYMFIVHQADEDLKKEHKHIYLIPNGRIDTNILDDYLSEVDPTNIKPLGCMIWRAESLKNFGDAYLYYLHDITYLEAKGMHRNLHYKECDIYTSDNDQLSELVRTIDYRKLYGTAYIKYAIENNIPFAQLVAENRIPMQQIRQAKEYYSEMMYYYKEIK